jgi:DNA-binding PadR family transcriptional regulator
MAGDHAELRATSYAVLGLLSFGQELSGFDMKRWADWSLKFFYWAPSFSQIYGELHKLEALGLVTSRLDDNKNVQRRRGEREKRVYRISADGERAVSAWTTEAEPEPAMLKHGIMLRAWLGHTADPAKLREVVLAHLAHSERMRVLALDHAEGAAPVAEWAYPVAVLNWSAQYYADECARAETLLVELDRLAAQRRRKARRKPKDTQAGR